MNFRLTKIAIFTELVSCAAPQSPAAPTAAKRDVRALPSSDTSSPAPTSSAKTEPVPQPATARSVEPPTTDLLAFERLLENPVHSLALGKPGRVAALGDGAAWIDDGKGIKPLPAPPKTMRDVHIYFGRDDQPRLMGFVRGPTANESVYLRFRNGAWQRGASEIGRLGGGPPAALFGVLGYDDPEVVCREGDQCVVKRLSGWKTIPAPAGLPEVVLCGSTPWAFEKDRVFRLEEKGFKSAFDHPPFQQVDGIWAFSEKEIWIAESPSNRVHHFESGHWTTTSSPVDVPRALWATNASDVWLAGKAGVAHFDGKSWTLARGAPPGATVVRGRGSDEVWFAGASGIWRGKRRSG